MAFEKLNKLQTTYNIKGMTCGGCVAQVKQLIESVSGVTEAKVQLENPQAEINSINGLDLVELQQVLGKYQISSIQNEVIKPVTELLPKKSIDTYKPLILIVAFITGVTLLAQYPFTEFSAMLWMRHFMAGFFIVFAFFKLLNLSGFANSYAMYDVVAKRIKTWGYIYPFIELALGLAYLINFNPLITNLATLLILGIGTIGVVKSNLSKKQIKCACLGDVFNLPMSTVTIIENVSMLLMAAAMLFI